jgi:hypothetical protein
VKKVTGMFRAVLPIANVKEMMQLDRTRRNFVSTGWVHFSTLIEAFGFLASAAAK